MAEILEFKTKAERAGLAPPTPYVDMTADDRYMYLYGKTLVHLRDLVAVYRETKRFTSEHEAAMIKIVTDLKHMCLDLAGTTGDSDGEENIG